MKIWDVDVNNIVILKLVETSSRYLIGYIVKVMRLLVLILYKMRAYVKTFEVSYLMKIKINTVNWCLYIDHDELLENYKVICIKIEGLKKTEFNALPVL